MVPLPALNLHNELDRNVAAISRWITIVNLQNFIIPKPVRSSRDYQGQNCLVSGDSVFGIYCLYCWCDGSPIAWCLLCGSWNACELLYYACFCVMTGGTQCEALQICAPTFLHSWLYPNRFWFYL